MDYSEHYQILELGNGALGAPFTHVVPGEYWERIETARFQFQCSGVAATRTVYVQYLTGDGNIFARWVQPTSQAAGSLDDYTFANEYGFGGATSVGLVTAGMTSILMPPGTKLQLNTTNIDVGDQFKDVRLYVCRFPSGKWAPSPGATPYRDPEIGY